MSKETPNPEGNQGQNNYEEMNRLLASQKSFVGAAVVVFFLYWLFYLPGLIFNYIWIKDAEKVKKAAGTSPSGLGCLYVMFIIGLIPLILFFFICSGMCSAADQTGREFERQQQQDPGEPLSMERSPDTHTASSFLVIDQGGATG